MNGLLLFAISRIIRAGSCATLGALFLASIVSTSATAQECEPTADRHAYKIQGRGVDGALNDFISPEIYGNHNFTQTLPNGWVFTLGAAKYGWKVSLIHTGEGSRDVDLFDINPPFSGAPNTREIYGWHLRNEANTGPNEGDVNAPQLLRRFIFSKELIGSGGFKPSTDPATPRLVEPDPNDGRGWLKIEDYGLSDLQPGQKARMTYLKFDACLSWPKTDDEQQIEADNANPHFSDVDHEIYGSCGLDLSAYDLHAVITPRELSGDMDGDGAHDQIAQIRRKSDGRRGLALCRAGTWMHVIGMETNDLGEPDLGFLPNMESWRFIARDHGNFGYVDEPEWPQADGDILALERIEKELVLVYWQDDGLKSQRVFRLVEP